MGEPKCLRTHLMPVAPTDCSDRVRAKEQIWWAQQDSNLRPADYESVALPLRHGPASGRIIPNQPDFRVCAVPREEPAVLHLGSPLCIQSG
jgi:hypothetical protein